MSNKLFTQKEIDFLSKNPYVKHISKKGITYTKEFKDIFIKEYNTGLYTVTMIFEKYGLSKDILGEVRIYSCSDRWRRQFNQLGCLEDTRTTKSGRPRIYKLTKDLELIQLKNKVKVLKQENEFLKKIQFLDKKELYIQKQKDLEL